MLLLYYQRAKRAGELDESLHRLVPKWYQNLQGNICREIWTWWQTRKPQEATDPSEGSVWRRAGGRMTIKNSHQQGKSLRSGWWLWKKICPSKWREGNLEGMLLPTGSNTEGAKKGRGHDGLQQQKLTQKVHSRGGSFMEGKLTKKKHEVSREKIR